MHTGCRNVRENKIKKRINNYKKSIDNRKHVLYNQVES